MQTKKQNSQSDNSLISLRQARQKIEEIKPLTPEMAHINDSVGRITVADIVAVSDCPSTDASLKDSFAVVSTDITQASKEHPVTLQIVGTLTAGQDRGSLTVSSGNTVRVMTEVVQLFCRRAKNHNGGIGFNGIAAKSNSVKTILFGSSDCGEHVLNPVWLN